MVGRVVSIKSLKTVTVLVESVVEHPLYKKTYKQSKKYLVDDAIGVKLGDIVDFINCKPVSKNKHWRITKVLGKNFAEIAKEELKKEAESIISEIMPEEKTEEPSVVKPEADKKIELKQRKIKKKKGESDS